MPRIAPDFLLRHRGLVAVTAIQAFCTLYFAIDVAFELPELSTEPMHPLIELLVVLALLGGTWLGLREIRRFLSEAERLEHSLMAARGAFLDLLDEHFTRWALTPAERDVALLAIKGLSIAEIAALRNTREGTVKAQSAAVYRKAGVSGRAQLLSLFVEDLMAGPVGGATRSSA
ncbi:helix-turn-helix transcriptional regulator [Rhodobacteraceae bacterium DSL-40]|uniref:response regulator transcription factor n=1 Tax=Amaricoccus sp. B4 TaxID=3368557 RepID=UPI000DACE105